MAFTSDPIEIPKDIKAMLRAPSRSQKKNPLVVKLVDGIIYYSLNTERVDELSSIDIQLMV